MGKIQWGASVLTWSPKGYELTLLVWLDSRASDLFGARVGEVLAEFFPSDEDPLVVTWVGGYRWERENAVGSEEGKLAITASRTIFALDVEAFRAALDALVASCAEEGEELMRLDREIADDWMKRLRG